MLQGSIALFRAIIDQFSTQIFLIFLILSYVCLLPWTKIPLIIAISFAILERSRVILSFVFAVQAGRARCTVICINPTHTQMFRTEQKNLFEVCKRTGRYNEFDCTLNLVLVVVLVLESKGLYYEHV